MQFPHHIKSLLPVAIGGLLAAALTPWPLSAAETTGTPGAPNATTTIPGDQLPPLPQKFEGVIRDTAAESQPYWPARVVPPKGAPNVLLVMTDDAGYGVAGTFGGVIPTPALDRIAQNGLRYTNFNSTALCSPTRAALITGRNHHSAGFGEITELATGFPGYDSVIGKDKATIGRILRDHGYHTAWFGKDHNTPDFLASQAGPFDQWPTGLGFDYFYGFLGGDTSQWQPNLFRNTTQIYPFAGRPAGTWNLTTAMADDAIDYIKRMHALTPEQPFFVYYVPGGTHAPHQPTKEWAERIGALHLFDGGWNALRETIFANQKRLGVIPRDAKLTPWPDDLLKRWETLGADEQRLFIRQADVFAAYVAYTDHEIGRVIQTIEDLGKLDNTLVIYIEGDNGTSAEGTMIGTWNEMAALNGFNLSVAEQLERFYDLWGTDRTYNHIATPWAWAFDTPFSWTKQIASHFGGVRQGMAIAWPKVIKDKGGIRQQFHHVIDIVPTILEATGIAPPESVDGIRQSPIEGVSMGYTFDAKNAQAPSTHHTQYFEMMGDRGLYHDGWFAGTEVRRYPWNSFAPVGNPMDYPWHLWDLGKDWTQTEDLGAKYPERLKELQRLFWAEAKKYQVLPLDNSFATRSIVPKPSITAGRDTFVWSAPMIGIPRGDAPLVLNTSYRIEAQIEVPQGGADGMLITQGGRFGGYGFYLVKDRPVFLWNVLDMERVRWEGPELTPGKHVLAFDFKYDGLGMDTLAFGSPSGIGQGGTGTLKVDGQEVASRRMERTIPFTLQSDESLDIGSDTLTGVNDTDYQPPFAFTGKIGKITLTLDPPKLSPEDIRRLKEAAATAAAIRE